VRKGTFLANGGGEILPACGAANEEVIEVMSKRAEEGVAPRVLREYALVADGERGALIGPDGSVAWLCVPRWDSPPAFSGLLGGAGRYTVTPTDPWHVWGGYYENGSLI
jgi:Trehalase-like, N-terminal